jgi:hypothetical protein
MDFYQPVETVLGSLMGLRKKLNNIVHTSSEDLNSNELYDLSATFDEKVKSVMLQTIYSNWEIALSIGLDGLNTLPEALELSPRLPLGVFTPSRKSTLERYERHLSQ